MALKDILVHLDTGPRAMVRLGVAIGLARRHGAHVTALCVIDLPQTEYFYGAAMSFSGTGPEQVIDRMRADAATQCATIESSFRDTLRREGVQGEWRLVEGQLPSTLALHARYSDLSIIGQPNPYDSHVDAGRHATIVTPLLSCGRPILAVPFAGDCSIIGEQVLVAWNASREAARAVNDAMPLLELAKKVTILAVNPKQGIGGHGDVPAADIALHLARHGVRAEAAHTVANDIPDGEALLSYAADLGIDLIVAGAYGHSRAREMVFGGVTRTLIEEMTVPVLLSH
jgi:nucleotide-binding universal stress UspA family protein